MLVAQESVQKELELSGEQKTALEKFAEDNRQAMMDMRNSGLSFEEMGAKMQDRQKENRKKLADLLLRAAEE